MKSYKLHITIILLPLIGSLFSLMFCSKHKSSTDVTIITPVNKFVTKTDMAKGITKTTNSITHVEFSHKVHDRSDIKCIDCHHKKKNDARIKTCSFCHKGLQGTILLHDTCISCHAKKKEGPKDCNGCHLATHKDYISKEIRDEYKNTKTFDKQIHDKHIKWKIACKVCHHRDYNKDKQEKCSRCHTGRSQMKIMHIFCKDCHKGNNRLKKQVGPVACNKCHLPK